MTKFDLQGGRLADVAPREHRRLIQSTIGIVKDSTAALKSRSFSCDAWFDRVGEGGSDECPMGHRRMPSAGFTTLPKSIMIGISCNPSLSDM